jgi:hypothetical protein
MVFNQPHQEDLLFSLSSTFPIEGLYKGRKVTTLKNHLQPKRGSSDGRITSRRVNDYKRICTAVHRDGVATGASISDRGDPDARAANGSGGVASDGIER